MEEHTKYKPGTGTSNSSLRPHHASTGDQVPVVPVPQRLNFGSRFFRTERHVRKQQGTFAVKSPHILNSGEKISATALCLKSQNAFCFWQTKNVCKRDDVRAKCCKLTRCKGSGRGRYPLACSARKNLHQPSTSSATFPI